jgi:hypothetical protein
MSALGGKLPFALAGSTSRKTTAQCWFLAFDRVAAERNYLVHQSQFLCGKEALAHFAVEAELLSGALSANVSDAVETLSCRSWQRAGELVEEIEKSSIGHHLNIAGRTFAVKLGRPLMPSVRRAARRC